MTPPSGAAPFFRCSTSPRPSASSPRAEVPLTARIADVELSGTADRAFGTPLSGGLRAPFLIVVQAKRGVEAQDPVAQLYGEILAAGCLNHQENEQSKQRIYGAYTVGDD